MNIFLILIFLSFIKKSKLVIIEIMLIFLLMVTTCLHSRGLVGHFSRDETITTVEDSSYLHSLKRILQRLNHNTKLVN